ncbi:hypothetical protein DPMN_095641 [Dreissena polymorpha]|uniref:Uncharacterized protein n=1 Tax=Dreissena polymorpha TaxID=45954 RepID=A0A9D4L896_DREPO|nr:hypothetical protein DPMN_095641 [Dreissena polymorpha]
MNGVPHTCLILRNKVFINFFVNITLHFQKTLATLGIQILSSTALTHKMLHPFVSHQDVCHWANVKSKEKR